MKKLLQSLMTGLMSIFFMTAAYGSVQQSRSINLNSQENDSQWISKPAKENIKFAFKAGYVCSVCPLAMPMLPITAPICILMMGLGLSGSYNKGDGWMFPTYFAGLAAGVATWGIPLYALNKCYGWF